MAPNKTGPILQKLRLLMKNTKYVSEALQAYIIPSGDCHQSEYVADGDKRRAFISGFTGSTGTAIVTENEAALWTDGRYFLQATSELDQNWTLIKEGVPHAVTPAAWLNKVLPTGSRVGVDPFMIGTDIWSPLSSQLESNGNTLVPIVTNLIDLIWDNKPVAPQNPIMVLDLKYAGKSWKEKVKEVREKMKEKKASVYVVSALDDIAWLLNLRGSDIDYNPVFFAYVIITLTSVHLLVDETKVTSAVRTHLKSSEANPITIYPYKTIKEFLKNTIEQTNGRVWVSKSSSYAIYSIVPQNRLVFEASPIAAMKAIKNPVELEGMQKAHIRDAVALCEYFAWLENNIKKGNITEISGAEKLLQFRREQADFMGLSFETISSSGPNAAIIHYTPLPETDRPITTNELYLCDSGGQYRDGTTDVTRTLHFGVPSQYEKECFTCVLKGHIALCTAVFPPFIKGQMLDSFARKSLWDKGLDYQHGTGHGVGSFLNVHEGPMGIGIRPYPDDPGLQEGMVLSDEPGYYEDKEFGIRIENVVAIKKAKTKYNFRNQDFLTFEPITLVPFQTKMLEPSMLTAKEIEWLDSYHERCLQVVGKVLEREGRKQALEWLMQQTRPLG